VGGRPATGRIVPGVPARPATPTPPSRGGREKEGLSRCQDDGVPDQVDRLVSAWRRERPDLQVEPLQVLSRVSRLARHLELARREAFARLSLAEWQFDVLAALRRSGPPYELTPGELLAETLVSSGTMTHRIDQMEAAGLVSRQPDPSDGRAVRVRLTDRGREAVDAALGSLLERERVLLERLASGERADLARLLRTLLEPFDG
jgi:DNA-binding MarR family transcriptional regulator